MHRSRGLWIGIAVTMVVLAALCVLLAAVGYALEQRRALRSRPLVLIHNPLAGDRLALEQGTIVQATGRSPGGVERMELWVDGEEIAAEEAPPDITPSTLVLNAAWEAQAAGEHVLIVRAVSADGVDGQASIVVESVADEAGSEVTYTIQAESETLASVAETLGTSEAELGTLNPEHATGGLQPGDVLAVPDETDDETAEPAPPVGQELAPVPDTASPGSVPDVAGVVFRAGEFEVRPAASVPLQVEILHLNSGAPLDSLHCYIGWADHAPRWYPDTDADQSTDESFTDMGGGEWDVASYLSGVRAPSLLWPGNRAFTAQVRCVGVASGGTEAVNLGIVEISASPEAWDGVTRRAESLAGEGWFALEYRIHQEEAEPKFLDPTMTPPSNVGLGAFEITWEYAPRSDELPVDGFRIYLNNSLLWVAGPADRRSPLPPEYYNPPCGVEYRFTVTAFRAGFPDGPESPHSEPAIAFTGDEGDPECDGRVVVTFTTLRTLRIRESARGPIYGAFYAGDAQLEFNTRHAEAEEVLLESAREYSIGALTLAYAGEHPRLTVEVPAGEDLEIGFRIMDYDRRSRDDEVCAGEVRVPADELAGAAYDGAIRTERCEVEFTLAPTWDSPVGSGEAWDVPLPSLKIERLTVDEATGQMEIHVRNVGRATWPAIDLLADITRPSGEAVGRILEPNFMLRPGDRAVLTDPGLAPLHPREVCVTLDPANAVPEARELMAENSPWCNPLPDLVIRGVEYDRRGEALLLSVENIGEGTLERQDVIAHLTSAIGIELAHATARWNGLTIPPHGTLMLTWSGINAEERVRLAPGYSIELDPDDTLEEPNANNLFEVRAAQTFRFALHGGSVPYYAFDAFGRRLLNEDTFNLLVAREEAGFSELVLEWRLPSDPPCMVGTEDGYVPGCIPARNSSDFLGYGDQRLFVTMSGTLNVHNVPMHRSLGQVTFTLEPEEWSDAPVCGSDEEAFVETEVNPPHLAAPWYFTWSICRPE